MENYNQTIIKLYGEGKSCEEIGRILGKSGKTIAYHLKKNNIKIKTSKINKEILDKYIDKSDEEIAKIIGCSKYTVKGFRLKCTKIDSKYRHKIWFSQENLILTDLQKQFIYGSLLGDLSIRKDPNGQNARLCLVHCAKQKNLFMEKVRILDIFMGNYKNVNTEDRRTNKIYYQIRGNSKAHPEFTNIYNILYINNVKTITSEFLNLITHPIALAYWFMDDGTNRGTFATNCFSEKEVDLLIEWLKNKWNITCTKQKNLSNFVIHIAQKSRKDFEDLIYPYVIPSMYYKLQYY